MTWNTHFSWFSPSPPSPSPVQPTQRLQSPMRGLLRHLLSPVCFFLCFLFFLASLICNSARKKKHFGFPCNVHVSRSSHDCFFLPSIAEKRRNARGFFWTINILINNNLFKSGWIVLNYSSFPHNAWNLELSNNIYQITAKQILSKMSAIYENWKQGT